ncbi:MAG: hypothetical protein ACI4JT_06815 [Oscillospiraceae bacterium]
MTIELNEEEVSVLKACLCNELVELSDVLEKYENLSSIFPFIFDYLNCKVSEIEDLFFKLNYTSPNNEQ